MYTYAKSRQASPTGDPRTRMCRRSGTPICKLRSREHSPLEAPFGGTPARVEGRDTFRDLCSSCLCLMRPVFELQLRCCHLETGPLVAKDTVESQLCSDRAGTHQTVAHLLRGLGGGCRSPPLSCLSPAGPHCGVNAHEKLDHPSPSRFSTFTQVSAPRLQPADSGCLLRPALDPQQLQSQHRSLSAASLPGVLPIVPASRTPTHRFPGVLGEGELQAALATLGGGCTRTVAPIISRKLHCFSEPLSAP